jgi:hypothetical protein
MQARGAATTRGGRQLSARVLGPGQMLASVAEPADIAPDADGHDPPLAAFAGFLGAQLAAQPDDPPLHGGAGGGAHGQRSDGPDGRSDGVSARPGAGSHAHRADEGVHRADQARAAPAMISAA